MVRYEKTVLVSDVKLVGKVQDVMLKNPWGIVVANDSIWTTSYTGYVINYGLDGTQNQLVTVQSNTQVESLPTGLVKYTGSSFLVTNGIVQLPAQWITVTSNGTINAYNSVIEPTTALIQMNDVTKDFKGCDIIDDQLYVANFYSGFVEIYDGTFTFVSQFTDDAMTEQGYAPFNVKEIDGMLYVAFAKQDATKHRVVPGIGNGYIDVFRTDGTFVQRFANRDNLNSPWAMLPITVNSRCKMNKKMLLIGNFSDGKILMYSPTTNKFKGFLCDRSENPILIDGLWGVVNSGSDIYFAAGMNSVQNGVVGKLSLTGY